MNRTFPVCSVFVYSSQPSLGKMSKQFLYKYKYQCKLIFLVIWLGIIRLKYNSFDTESQQKNKNFIFAVHITDLIPIYALRAIPLTQSKLQLIMIALKRSPFSFCLMILTGNIGKSLFILELGQITTVSPTCSVCSSYLV